MRPIRSSLADKRQGAPHIGFSMRHSWSIRPDKEEAGSSSLSRPTQVSGLPPGQTPGMS